MTEPNRTYHGVQPTHDDDGQCRILVEKTKLGPTERQVDGLVLYELTPKDAEALGGFNWATAVRAPPGQPTRSSLMPWTLATPGTPVLKAGPLTPCCRP